MTVNVEEVFQHQYSDSEENLKGTFARILKNLRFEVDTSQIQV
jgi:hypothetical protein